MKTLCACEIYWSSEIGEGFFIDHGMGSVIGSRVTIGKGFYMHHGCTVGHKSMTKIEDGPKVGNNVILCTGSQILGNITIGNNVIIKANSVVKESIK